MKYLFDTVFWLIDFSCSIVFSFFFFVLFVFVLCLLCPMLSVSLDCQFLAVISVFSIVYRMASLNEQFAEVIVSLVSRYITSEG